MAKPDTIIIDGHAYSWQQICDLRRRQIEARRAAQAQQLVLFPMHEDSRPGSERTTAGRYEEPTLLELMRGAK
jgi:hypothetical protein